MNGVWKVQALAYICKNISAKQLIDFWKKNGLKNT